MSVVTLVNDHIIATFVASHLPSGEMFARTKLSISKLNHSYASWMIAANSLRN